MSCVIEELETMLARAIDELHIFDAALLPEQIMQLNDANRTVGAEPLPK